MTNDLITYSFKNNPIRTLNKNGEVWFVAKDVADALEYRSAPDAIRCLDPDEKDKHNVRTLRGSQSMNIINESGLYSLILLSRKPEAKTFKKWVTSEVLPSIRKTGAYGAPLDVKSLAAAVASELKTQLAAPRKVSYIPEILQDFCRDQVLRMDIVTPFADIYQIFELYCLSHDKPTPSANRLSRYLQSEGFQKTTDRRGNKAFVLGIKEYDKSRFRYVFAPIDGYNGAGIYRCKNGECYQIIDKISGKGASYSWYNLRTGQAEGPFGTCNIEDFNDRIVSKMTSKIEIMGIDGAALYLGSAK